MLETQLLGGKLFSPSPRYGNCGRVRWSDDFEIARPDFDFARFHLRVSHLDRACGHFALERDDGFQTELARPLNHVDASPPGIERDLDESGAIPKVEENDSAKISRAVYPAAEFDFGTGVRRSELSAEVRASGRRETGGRGRGGQRWEVWVQ